MESSIDKTAGNADINDDDDDDRIATNYQNDDDDHRSNEFENLLHKCAQILTLKGDILKDFNRWQDAIEVCLIDSNSLFDNNIDYYKLNQFFYFFFDSDSNLE